MFTRYNINSLPVVKIPEKTILYKPAQKHQDWFDANDTVLSQLIDDKNNVREKILNSRLNTSSICLYKQHEILL